MKSKKRKIILLTAILLCVVGSLTSCSEDIIKDFPLTIRWVCRDTSDNDFGIDIDFHLSKDGKTIVYESYYSKNSNYPMMDEFEIIGNIKPFNDWNECNIKFSNDITKSWVFRYEGKNIFTDISFLYNNKNIGDTLIFWDSDTTKYYFKKIIF